VYGLRRQIGGAGYILQSVLNQIYYFNIAFLKKIIYIKALCIIKEEDLASAGN